MKTEYKIEEVNSVLLSTGAFVFQQELLSIEAVGTGSFRFGLNYLSSMVGSMVLGGGFQFAQNVYLSQFSDGDISLSTGAHTFENFDYDSQTDTYSSITVPPDVAPYAAALGSVVLIRHPAVRIVGEPAMV
jgi:hypothetical protein